MTVNALSWNIIPKLILFSDNKADKNWIQMQYDVIYIYIWTHVDGVSLHGMLYVGPMSSFLKGC